jgi:TonB family protein
LFCFAMKTPTRTESASGHARSSDLSKFCLPQEYKDSNRKLAWVNSICCLFLLIGIAGLRQPPVVAKPLTEVVDIVPVVFIPPPEPPQTEPERNPELAGPPQETLVAQPQVETVAAVNSPAVAFAVPVSGPVILAPARFALPPPSPQQLSPPAPKTFNPGGTESGAYPEPTYPRAELLARHEGSVTLYVVVDSSGSPSSVTVKDSSRYPGLDQHAAQWIKSRWHWPPGKARYYYVPIVFQIR